MFDNLRFHEVSERQPTAEEVQKFQEEYDFSLPAAFVDFCYQYNGGFPLEVRFVVPDKFKDFHKEYPLDEGLRIDFLFGLNPSIDHLDVARNRKLFEKSAPVRVLPIGEDFLGNFAVVRCDTPEGKVYWLDHEVWDAPEEPHLFPIAENLRLMYENLHSAESNE